VRASSWGVCGNGLHVRVLVTRTAVAAPRERRRRELLERRAEGVLELELQRDRAARLEVALVATGVSRVIDRLQEAVPAVDAVERLRDIRRRVPVVVAYLGSGHG